MNILYLTEEQIQFSGAMTRGGAIHVRRIVDGLRERNHQVELIDWNDHPERSYQHSLSPTLRFGLDPTRTALSAVQVGKRMEVDVILSKTRKTYLPGLIASQWLNVPHVAHIGTVPDSTTHGLIGRMNGISVSMRLRAPHDAYFVVGDSVRDVLRERGIADDKIFDVRNAVDTETFSPDKRNEEFPDQIGSALDQTEDGFRVGFIGGLYWYKGLEHLATAVKRCESDVSVVIAGDGPERDALESQFGDNAEFLGIVPYDEVPSVYRSLDTFVLPSYTETLSRVVLEAQSSGTPVIATSVGGIPEIVTDGENGLLCPPKDAECLAEAIDRLANDSSLRTRLATNGRQSVLEAWSWDDMLDRYEKFLEDVLN